MYKEYTNRLVLNASYECLKRLSGKAHSMKNSNLSLLHYTSSQWIENICVNMEKNSHVWK